MGKREGQSCTDEIFSSKLSSKLRCKPALIWDGGSKCLQKYVNRQRVHLHHLCMLASGTCCGMLLGVEVVRSSQLLGRISGQSPNH